MILKKNFTKVLILLLILVILGVSTFLFNTYREARHAEKIIKEPILTEIGICEKDKDCIKYEAFDTQYKCIEGICKLS